MYTPIFLATLIASLASYAAADSCNAGGIYCGQSLLNKGNYRTHIIQVLQGVGQPADEPHIQNSKFSCGEGGNIFFQQYCGNGCGGVGSTADDYCL